MFRKFSFVAALIVGFSFTLAAQEFRGTLAGLVTDPTGLPIAGVNVTVTETNTGTKVQATSDAAGQYTAPFLLPGDYQIDIKMQGFKEFSRKALHVGAGDHIRIDVRLEVGDTSQTVEVTADAPLLNMENASTGQAITTAEVEDLPINGRTPAMLASLSIGVIATGNPSLTQPFSSGGGAAWSIGGTYAQTSELLVDGSPNATWDGRLAYSPPQDAVQEVRVKAFDSDAAFGHTGGGTLNQVMKTGTNNLHGSLWEFNQASNLTANNFFNNKAGIGNPLTHYNQYGLTAGGPVYIPKVLNGRNKLFWFFAWEGVKDSQPNTDFTSVPTDAEKRGDFSQILKADGTQLYDPFTAILNGSTITRSPYAGNQLPTSQLNSIAQAYLKFYPEPNVLGLPARPDGQGNYGNNNTSVDNFNNELGRIDYNMSDRSRLFGNVRRTDYYQIKNNYFSNISTGSILTRANWGGSLDEVFTVSASNVLDVRFNFTRMAENHAEPSDGFNPVGLGFPAYMAANSQYLQIPFIGFAGSCGSQTSFQCLGGSGANTIPSQSTQLFGSWIHIHGSHTFKFGGDARQYRLNTFTPGNSAGTFSFTGNNWVRASSSASSTVAWGQDFASFLLGLPTGGSFDTNAFGSFYSYYVAGFVQDDWRVSRTLTLNLGLRFDHDGPYQEKYGRTVNGFGFNTPNPLAAAAKAAYAKSPNAALPVNQFDVLGGLTFASPDNRGVFENTSHLVSPRVGFAWSPDRFHGKTVIRGGFGMFVSPIGISTLSITGSYSTNPILNQEGFSQSTAFISTNNNNLSPASTLANPFPNGFAAPVGSAQGLLTFAGQSVSFLNPEMKSPYSLRWTFGIQQELAKNLMLEVVYIGNHAVHLPVAVTQVNGIPTRFLSTLGVRDPSVAYLSNSTPNPFAGLATSQNGSTISTAQLLARYPEFPVGDTATGWTGSGGILDQNNNVGSSYFESLNIRLQKRLSNGLSLTFNFIHSKLIEFDSWLNDGDPRPEKRISPTDRPNRFVTGVTYELPIGKGRPVNVQSRWLNLLVGGWRVNSIYQFQQGGPFAWVNGSSTTPGDYLYFGGPLNFDNREANATAFNTGAFDTKSADAFQYHIRTFSTTFGNLRSDGINQWDASFLKRFDFGERRYLQLRFEGFNVLNHPTFGPPNLQGTNAQFGLITSQSNRPRTIQIGARIVF